MRHLVLVTQPARTGEPPADRSASPVGAYWFTGEVTNLQPVPTDPTELKAWLDSLDPAELLDVAHQVASGSFLGAQSILDTLDDERRNRPIDPGPPPAELSLLTLTIELHGSTPRIWRRLALPGDLTLDAVHTLFQAAMGWSDSHLHHFHPGVGDPWGRPYFVTELDEEEGDVGTREDGIRLDQVLREPGDRLTYLYDFGDGWEHRVVLESLAPLTPDNRQPTCLHGAKACPLEDVGGLHGHDEIAAWLRAGAPADAVPAPFEDLEHARGWIPDDYDPDEFDAAETTAAMRRWASGEHLPWHAVPEPLAALVQTLRGSGWSLAIDWLDALDALGPKAAVELTDDEVRQAAHPWLAVLDAVGDGVALTAAGYLPPALVRRVGEAIAAPGHWVGSMSREDQTWPVAVLRENAQAAGLLRKARGRLAPTARARAVSGRPRELVARVLERLPFGRGFEADAGWFLLLGLAAGEAGNRLEEGVADLLTGRGWGTQHVRGINASGARSGYAPTLGALESMAGGYHAADDELVTRLARAALFGVAPIR